MTVPQPSLGDKPSRMPPADLGSAFSGKSRSDGLGGRLAPMKLAPTLPVQLPQAPEVSTPEPKAARAITPRPVKAPAAPAVRSDASSGLQPIVVYVSASIRERLRNGAGEWTYANLQTRFVEQPAPGKSMFAGRGRATTRRHTEPHVQISLRPLRDDLAVIDRLSSELNAPSRSALINAALDEYLPRDQ